jgi:hypothetical protein
MSLALRIQHFGMRLSGLGRLPGPLPSLVSGQEVFPSQLESIVSVVGVDMSAEATS